MVGCGSPSAVYTYEKNMNLNEIMHKLVSSVPKTHVLEEDLSRLLVFSAMIGKLLEKAKIRMFEFDPKNIYRNELDEYKLGSCFRFFLPGTDLKAIQGLSCDNVP